MASCISRVSHCVYAMLWIVSSCAATVSLVAVVCRKVRLYSRQQRQSHFSSTGRIRWAGGTEQRTCTPPLLAAMARPPRCRHDRQGALALAVLLLAGVAACAAHAQPEGAEAAAAAGAEAAQAAQAAQAATAVAGAAGLPSSAPSPPRSVSLGITEALGAWAESQPSGAALLAAELEVAEFPGMGVGMKAAAPLAAASALVDVPFSMVMSQSSAADSNIGPIIVGLSDKPGANHAMLLALHLLYERAVGAASPFKAFIDTLPGKVGLPMAWDPAMRKAELGGTRLEEQVEEQVRACCQLCLVGDPLAARTTSRTHAGLPTLLTPLPRHLFSTGCAGAERVRAGRQATLR